MRKKQIMLAAVGAVLAMSLAGCSGNPSAAAGTTAAADAGTTTAQTANAQTTAAETTAAEEPETAGEAADQEASGAEEVIRVNGGEEIPLSSLEHRTDSADASTVYFTSDITPEALTRIYEALGWTPTGNVAVKISTGEPPASNYLRPELIGDLVQQVNGTIVECNTAYGGSRAETAMHYQVAEDHGLTEIAEVSSEGKCWIHTGGVSRTSFNGGEQDHFLEAMGDAGKAVSDYLGNGERITYISVMNRISIDCDCDGNPAEPDIHDIGIMASNDPVALDQASIDLVSQAEGSESLMNRIADRNGIHTLENAEAIGLGSRTYQMVNLNSGL